MPDLVDDLLEIIDRQIAHEEKGWTKQEPQTHYSRGFVKGLKWSKTEIMKVFER